MDQTFTCADCGHVTTYRPEECRRFIRFKPDSGKKKVERYRVVRCAG